MTYAYDLAGRRTGVSDTGPTITPVSVASSVQYATAMTYDALNRPTGPASTAATPAAANVTFAHAYNAVNQRTGQSVSDNSWILPIPGLDDIRLSYTSLCFFIGRGEFVRQRLIGGQDSGSQRNIRSNPANDISDITTVIGASAGRAYGDGNTAIPTGARREQNA